MSDKPGFTEGPWVLATSNSWRRFVAERGGSVCEPVDQICAALAKARGEQ